MPLPNALRLRTLALIGIIFGLTACASETEEPPPKPEVEGDLSMVAFEATAYFEGSAQNARIIERIRREKESVVHALRRQQISVSNRKQVDVELSRAIREPITVVDTATGARRPALRVRYWFVGFGGVPAAMVQQKDVPFGLLHTDDDGKEPALAPCLLASPSSKPIWQRFDPLRESCKKAIEDEQTLIDAARQKLSSKDTEIVPLELERLYVPVSIHVTPRTGQPVKRAPEADAGAVAQGENQGQGEDQGGYHGKEPGGIEPPSSDNDGPPAAATLADKLREQARALTRAREREMAEQDAVEDLGDSDKLASPTWVVPPRQGGDNSGSVGSFIFTEPSFAMLWGLVLIMLIIGAIEYRRRQRRRSFAGRRQARRRLKRRA